jgi:integrase
LVKLPAAGTSAGGLYLEGSPPARLVESHSNLINRGFQPIQLAARISELRQVADPSTGKPAVDHAGKPVMIEVAKYGMHALRHACASLWIENGYNPKQIQRLMAIARSR